MVINIHVYYLWILPISSCAKILNLFLFMSPSPEKPTPPVYSIDARCVCKNAATRYCISEHLQLREVNALFFRLKPIKQKFTWSLMPWKLIYRKTDYRNYDLISVLAPWIFVTYRIDRIRCGWKARSSLWFWLIGRSRA